MTRAPDGFESRAEQIERNAAQWVTRIDLHGTPEEWAALDAWLAASPRHRAAFLRLSVAWRRADELKRLASLSGEVDEDLLDPARWSAAQPATAEADLSNARGAAIPPREPSQPAWLVSRRSNWQSEEAANAHPAPARWTLRLPAMPARLAASFVAVAIIVLAGAGSWYALNTTNGETYATAIGEFRRFGLSDGSSIALNTNSRVRVQYTATHRNIELIRGEALFTVAHNKQRPFDVTAGATTVRAVGTAFSVRLRDESSIDLLVSEGRIAINPPSDATLAAGSIATIRKGRLLEKTLTPNEIDGRLAWTAGRLTFQGETLADVASEFNRYNSRQLLVSDPAAARLRIGGTFNATDPDGFAKALERAFHIRAQHLRGATGREVIRLDSGVP